MVRLMFCFARRANVSVEEFRRYWNSTEHKNNISSLVSMFSPDRYADTLALHSTTVQDPYGANWSNKGYDAVLEMLWVDPSVFQARLLNRSVGRMSNMIRRQSEQWIDNDSSAIFLTEEPEIIECSLPFGFYRKSG